MPSVLLLVCFPSSSLHSFFTFLSLPTTHFFPLPLPHFPFLFASLSLLFITPFPSIPLLPLFFFPLPLLPFFVSLSWFPSSNSSTPFPPSPSFPFLFILSHFIFRNIFFLSIVYLHHFHASLFLPFFLSSLLLCSPISSPASLFFIFSSCYPFLCISLSSPTCTNPSSFSPFRLPSRSSPFLSSLFIPPLYLLPPMFPLLFYLFYSYFFPSCLLLHAFLLSFLSSYPFLPPFTYPLPSPSYVTYLILSLLTPSFSPSCLLIPSFLSSHPIFSLSPCPLRSPVLPYLIPFRSTLPFFPPYFSIPSTSPYLSSFSHFPPPLPLLSVFVPAYLFPSLLPLPLPPLPFHSQSISRGTNFFHLFAKRA